MQFIFQDRHKTYKKGTKQWKNIVAKFLTKFAKNDDDEKTIINFHSKKIVPKFLHKF